MTGRSSEVRSRKTGGEKPKAKIRVLTLSIVNLLKQCGKVTILGTSRQKHKNRNHRNIFISKQKRK